MIDPLALAAFLPAALALNLTPGADMMFCIGQGMHSGRRAAVAASAGIAAGCMVHVTLAGLGLGAVVAAMPALFEVIRWLGVAYLLFLAAAMLRQAPKAKDAPAAAPARAFRSGLFVNLANPKVILFVLALIPQFVAPDAGAVLGQFLVFGAILALGGFVINALAGIFAGRAGRALSRAPRAGRWLNRIPAAIFAALALRLALLERT